MRFELKAIAPGGNVERIDFQAPDETSAVQTWEGRGYTVLSVRARRALVPWSIGSERFPVVLFAEEVRALLGAGLPLVAAIETLAEKERREEWRGILERLVRALRQGQPLSAALEELPQVFSPLFVATVRASERSGELAPAFARYAAYANQLESVRKRIVNATIYPALLIAVGGLVSLFLLMYVVPRFARIYEERAADLPLFSKWLLAWGKAVDQHATLVVGTLALAVVAAVWFVRGPAVRTYLTDSLWRVPAIGERMKVYQLARFYRTIGMLLRGGMPMVSALALGAELLHPVLRGRLAAAGRAIAEGRGVSQSMEANGLTTPVALRLLTVGESSGNMGDMLEAIAAFHDEELARWVDWFTRLFEPLLMAAIGLVIGAIVILMYMPIFELAGNLQ